MNLFFYFKTVRFLISGGVAALSYFSLLYCLTEFLEIWYLGSSAFSILVSIAISFTLQKYWTFKDYSQENIGRQFFGYALYGVIVLFLHVLFLYVLVEFFGLWYLGASVIVTGTVAFLSFFVYQKIFFSHGPQALFPEKQKSTASPGVSNPDILLMISHDAKILEPGSGVAERMRDYATLFRELHIVVVGANHGVGMRGAEAMKIDKNIFIYPLRFRNTLLLLWDAYGVCGKILKKNPHILLTSQDGLTNIIALLLRLRFSFFFQVQIHTDFLNPLFRYGSFKNYMYYIGYLLGVVCADCVRVVSKRIERSLGDLTVSHNIPEIRTLPIYVDVEKVEQRPIIADLHKKYPQFEFLVLVASRLAKEKNILLALSAFRGVVTKYPRIGLIIVGEGPERNRIEKYIYRHGLQNNVIIENWVDEDILFSYLKTTHVFLSTSDYEGYGLMLLQAASVGCVIVSTDAGIVGEVLKRDESALVCVPNDGACISESIIRVYENPSLRHILGRNARSEAGSLAVTKEQYLKDYKESFLSCLNQNSKK